jgi:hypothetical protein
MRDLYLARYHPGLIVDLKAPLQDEADDLLLRGKPLELIQNLLPHVPQAILDL